MKKKGTIINMILMLLYSWYSFILNLIFFSLELMPFSVRLIVFRLLFDKLGNDVLIDYGTYFRYPKKIRIGSGVHINRGCELYAAYRAMNGTINIGNNVALGPHVKIFAAGHDYTSHDLADTAGPVVIDDFVWVGGNSTILSGVHIGTGAVIGAGSVVTRDVPPYSVAVGNPARVIKLRVISQKNDS